VNGRTRVRLLEGRGVFLSSVGFLLAGYLVLELWDVSKYDWLRGYDAYAASLYVDAIQLHHHLPSSTDTDVWHNPPLFYAVAALIQPHIRWTGLEPHKAVQLLSVFSAFGVVALSFLIARELFPRSRAVWLWTLLAAGTTPVLLRGALMYHPEPLATFLATSGVYVAVRGAMRGWTVRRGLAAGVLLGLSNLTRTWGLAEAAAVVAVCCMVWAGSRKPDLLRFTGAFIGVFLALSLPWYVRQEIHYGNPFAFSKPDPAQWLPAGRPSSFYTTLDVNEVFTNPYVPSYRNVLWPVLYTDWWGDYSRYFHVPLAELEAPSRLEGKYRKPLVVQSIVGIAPSLLALAGAITLGIRAFRRRQTGLLIVVAAAVLVAAAFLGFLIRDVKVDGDNLKALYVIDLVPATALCTAWSIDWVRRHGSRLVFGCLLVWLAGTLYYDVTFLVLT